MVSKLNVFKLARYGFPWWRIDRYVVALRYAWQRATKGYCDYDLWDLKPYFSHLFIAALGEMVPEDESVFKEEYADGQRAWYQNLREICQNFENGLLESDEEMDELRQKLLQEVYTEKERQELVKLFAKKMEEFYEWRKQEIKSGFDKFADVFDDLWNQEIK